ncbi:TPA: MazG nucleotide pyrophosphohydrolase domain-containing protein [Streptococcus suis]
MALFEIVNEKIKNWAEGIELLTKGNPISQFDKILEECDELFEIYANDFSENFKAVEDEYGDLLHSVLVLGLMLGVDPVDALEQSNIKNSNREWQLVGGRLVRDKEVGK